MLRGSSQGQINVRDGSNNNMLTIVGQSNNFGAVNATDDGWLFQFTATQATFAGIVLAEGSLELGYRDIPRVTGGIERGKCHAASSGVTLNTGAAAGSTYSIYNDSGSAITITQGSGLTLRLAGTGTTGNRTLAARGFATIWFNGTTEAIVSGAGVS
ncbi:MAG: hypothetical protein KF780_11720 [Sphingomonas sp.]|nr:hypothetical protein [Sphingomonas sp.]